MIKSAGATSDDNPYAGPNAIVSITSSQERAPALPELCARIHEKVEAFLNAEPRNERLRAVQAQSRISLDVIEEALQKYSVDELSLSYNGGKDCLVLLVLYLAALHSHAMKQTADSVNHSSTNAEQKHRLFPDTIPSVYIISPHPFESVEDFVTLSERSYHLSLARYAKPMREAFAEYLAEHKSIKAIFVGTRRTDPHGHDLDFFDPTDRGWPSFMRIHPVIDWHYAEIWSFIRELGIEYCALYDKGYTSLGGTTDTHPNPALAIKDPGDAGEGASWTWTGGEKFRPAYELVEDEEERLGRDWN